MLRWVGAAGWLCLVVLTVRPAAAREVPRRVVSLAPSVTETIFALGAGGRLVGVSTYCDYPPAAAQVDKVGTFLTPNVEVIVSKRPDLVIVTPSPGNHAPVETLRRVGLTVLVVEPNTVAEVLASIRTIAVALGVEDAGARVIAGIERQFAQVKQRLGDVAPRSVLMVLGQTPLVGVGPGTFADELITMARGTNVAAATGTAWPRLSLEFAIAAAPEVIIDTTMGNEERVGAAAALEFWRAFATIPAVRSGRVFGYKAYELLRPGPRLGDALATIARFIHPERFAPAPSPS